MGFLLGLAYPDRIARARGKAGEFVMANGRGAAIAAHEPLAREPFLAVAETAGTAAAARILAAAAITAEEVVALAGEALETVETLAFDRGARALRARAVDRFRALTLSERTLPVPATETAARLLARGLADLGIAEWPWTPALSQWRDRVGFLRRTLGGDWPDLADEVLARTAQDWLAPHLLGRTGLSSETLGQALHALLPWPLPQRLEAEAPTHVEAPTGSRLPVDYAEEPTLAVRVQELFGLNAHPAIGSGRVPLLLHLLSPAGRPMQITRDLPGFWRGSWAAIRAEMRGRYPRHPWPDDPANAAPTRRAKPRGT